MFSTPSLNVPTTSLKAWVTNKPITQATVDTACHAHQSRTKKPIGSVAPASSSMSAAQSETAGPSSHPVAAIMGYASNPVGYSTNYSSMVLIDDDEEDQLDSSEVCGHVTAIIEGVNSAALDSINLLKAGSDLLAPLTIPHMFWQASVSPPNAFPIQFNCLLDIGSHLVIIHEQLINDLNLH